jgi:hypothetical protein
MFFVMIIEKVTAGFMCPPEVGPGQRRERERQWFRVSGKAQRLGLGRGSGCVVHVWQRFRV